MDLKKGCPQTGFKEEFRSFYKRDEGGFGGIGAVKSRMDWEPAPVSNQKKKKGGPLARRRVCLKWIRKTGIRLP